MLNSLSLYFTAIVLTVFLSCSANAADINWGVATNVSGASDLISGNYAYALNGYAADETPSAIGTIPAGFTNTDYASLPVGVSVLSEAGGPTFAARGLNDMLGTSGTTGDISFDNLIGSITDSNGSPSGITAATMTFDNLIDGNNYSIQVFFNDQRGTSLGRVMTYGDGNGNSVSLAGNDGVSGGDPGEWGQFAVGNFTAIGTTQSLTMETSGFGNVHFNAILLIGDTVPPPPEAGINWGLATDVVDAGDVSTNGTLVEAFNYVFEQTGSGLVPADFDTTVNTVPFLGAIAPPPLSNADGGTPSFLGGETSGDDDYDLLLDTAAFGGGGGLVNMTVGGGNLVEGTEYEIQVWYVEERTAEDEPNFIDFSGRVMRYGDGNGNTVDVGGTSGLLGQYAIGTFTATGSDQILTLDAQGFGNAHLTAYQIRNLDGGSAPLVGDFNGDNVVDLADYTVWRNNLGAPESVLPSGTGDNSGTVDIGDYNEWKNNFGATPNTVGALSTATVPEPNALALSVLAFCGMAMVRLRSR